MHICTLFATARTRMPQVALEATDAGDFMQKAAKFANDKLWGTLACAVFIHPKTESKYTKEFEVKRS